MKKISQSMNSVHALNSDDLVSLFNGLFAKPYNIRLEGDHDEPLYSPNSGLNGEHILAFREDYFSSALHEIAHWCQAGEQRRTLEDFGYEYVPSDIRTPEIQRQFYVVEVIPQALECLFTLACGVSFNVSVDNFSVMWEERQIFLNNVVKQALVYWQQGGLPPRAKQWIECLQAHYQTPSSLIEDWLLEKQEQACEQ